MFIMCLDDNLKKKLISNGFKLLKDNKSQAIFLFDKNKQFNFESVDKKKFLFTNRLTF